MSDKPQPTIDEHGVPWCDEHCEVHNLKRKVEWMERENNEERK